MSQSPYYQQKIEWNEISCEYFERNPAQTHYSEALFKHIHLYPENDMGADELYRLIEQGNQEFEMALNLGLPENDEVEARSFLANGYRMLAKLKYDEADIRYKEYQDALCCIEKAVEIDVNGAYGYFTEDLNLKRLQEYDPLYEMQFRAIKEDRGGEYAMRYAEDKLRLYNRLSSPPLLNFLLDVGNYYGRKEDVNNAKRYFQQIVNTKTISSDDDEMAEWEASVREHARRNLQVADEQSRSNTGGGC